MEMTANKLEMTANKLVDTVRNQQDQIEKLGRIISATWSLL